MTIHKLCGLKVGNFSNEELENIAQRQDIQSQLRSIDVVIVDECGMVSDDILRQVDVVLKAARCSSRPFGGMQLLLAGDFFQLPPVSGKFCFEWNCFDAFIPHRVNLNTVFR